MSQCELSNVHQTCSANHQIVTRSGMLHILKFCSYRAPYDICLLIYSLELFYVKANFINDVCSASGQGGDISRELTHIIVDEIHERDSYSDFLLILLRDILPANPELKVLTRFQSIMKPK